MLIFDVTPRFALLLRGQGWIDVRNFEDGCNGFDGIHTCMYSLGEHIEDDRVRQEVSTNVLLSKTAVISEHLQNAAVDPLQPHPRLSSSANE